MNGPDVKHSLPDCIVLAGGAGSRLRGVLPEGVPKILAPVAGKPFAWWLIQQLYQQGVRYVVLALGYGATRVRESIAAEAWPGDLTIQTVVEESPLGTGGALRCAFDSTQSDPVLLVNGDTLTDVDLHELVACHVRNHASVTMALADVPDASRYGAVACLPNGLVTGFEEKSQKTALPRLINAGVYCLARRWVVEIPVEKTLSLERELLPAMIGQGFFACRVVHRFIDIGTPLSLREAGEFITQPVGGQL